MATSKPSFRARALDTSKPLPIYRTDETTDATDLAAMQSRTVTQAPTGMEKEEEEVRVTAMACVAVGVRETWRQMAGAWRGLGPALVEPRLPFSSRAFLKTGTPHRARHSAEERMP